MRGPCIKIDVLLIEISEGVISVAMLLLTYGSAGTFAVLCFISYLVPFQLIKKRKSWIQK